MNFPGQYILTTTPEQIPRGWTPRELSGWWLGSRELNVLSVENGDGQLIGLCFGHPIDLRAPRGQNIVLRVRDGEIPSEEVEGLYRNMAGRYALLVVSDPLKRLYLDPYGSLATVFAVDKPIVASNPLLLSDSPWEERLITALNMPASGLWYPSGLTPKQGVRRLLPNHFLDLCAWTVQRHWPRALSDLSVDSDVESGVAIIVDGLERAFASLPALAQMPLTAGRDSRTLLACARKILDRTTFVTFAEAELTVDMQIAKALSRQFKLSHEFLQAQRASSVERQCWLDLTGHCVSGRIWEIHKTLERVSATRVLTPAIGGEVGRAFYWREDDREDTPLSAEKLLTRARLPIYPPLVAETEAWLADLRGFPAFGILDLFYVEQRLGCWAAPQHYGNTTSLFEFFPFNQRQIFTAMMRLPYEFRRRQELTRAICQRQWPELLNFPFNEFIGARRYWSNPRRLIRRLRHRLGRLSGRSCAASSGTDWRPGSRH